MSRTNLLRVLVTIGIVAVSGCGQAVLSHKLNALNARFENRLRATQDVLALPTVGTPYAAQLHASGGVAPYHWKIVQGSLPPGLTLEPSTGAITGVPTGNAETPIVVQLTDSSGNPKSYVFESVQFEAPSDGAQ